MMNTDDPSMSRYVRKYGVYELPHFEFFAKDGEKELVPEAGGPVDVERIKARVNFLLFPSE